MASIAMGLTSWAMAVLSDNDQVERLNYNMAKAMRGYTDERALDLDDERFGK
jgi:hypothetical protein